MTTPLEAAYAELHRQLAPIGKLEEGGIVYVAPETVINLAALVAAVLGAQWQPDDGTSPLTAAREAIARTKAGGRTIADHVAHGLYYWRAHDLERSSLTDLALFEAAVACLQEYLLRQPQARTAQEMLGDLYPPESRSPGHR